MHSYDMVWHSSSRANKWLCTYKESIVSAYRSYNHYSYGTRHVRSLPRNHTSSATVWHFGVWRDSAKVSRKRNPFTNSSTCTYFFVCKDFLSLHLGSRNTWSGEAPTDLSPSRMGLFSSPPPWVTPDSMKTLLGMRQAGYCQS